MAMGLVPDGEGGGTASCQMVPRRWDVAIFDWAYLTTEHNMHFPYQMADSYARSCNLEFAIEANSHSDAITRFRSINLSLLALGTAPFAIPMISTHSINDFSNIYGAAIDPSDARHERAKAIWSKNETVEVWGVPGASGGMGAIGTSRTISASQVEQAVAEAELWRRLVGKQPVLRLIEDTILSVPQTADLGQGILQMWTGLESLFPRVQTEVSFRIALYLAQLRGATSGRLEYFNQVKKAYGVRSKVAHGGSLREKTKENHVKWTASWQVLVDAYRAILKRHGLPDDETLIGELLQDADRSSPELVDREGGGRDEHGSQPSDGPATE